MNKDATQTIIFIVAIIFLFLLFEIQYSNLRIDDTSPIINTTNESNFEKTGNLTYAFYNYSTGEITYKDSGITVYKIYPKINKR